MVFEQDSCKEPKILWELLDVRVIHLIGFLNEFLKLNFFLFLSISFAATATLEYAYLLFKGKIYSLSEQEFLDCETQSAGCRGGYTYYALQYAQQHGANFEKDYPYETIKRSCRHKKNSPENIIKRVGLTKRNEKSIQSQLEHGPFEVSVCGDTKAWQHYKSGYLKPDDCDCGVNHAVKII